MKPRKEIKIFTCDGEQSATISLTETQDGILFNCSEVIDRSISYKLYMTKEEAILIGKELVNFAENEL